MAAITREQGDIVFDKICQIKDQTVEDVKKRAQELNKAVAQRDFTPLLNEGYAEFKSKVHQEFDQTPYSDLAEMLLSSQRIYFLSDGGLNKEICKIIDSH